MVLTKDEPHLSDIPVTDGLAYREEIVQTIDDYRYKLGEQKMDRKKIQNRLKLLKMRDEAIDGKDLTAIEKELWTMSLDEENPDFTLLTEQLPAEFNDNPAWSKDGNNIIYNNYVNTDEGFFIATLKMARLNNEFGPEFLSVLSNNIFKGFWNN